MSADTESLLAYVAEPYSALSEWKRASGKKIIGCAPMHCPEELVHAAGMLPVVLWEDEERITEGDAHIQPFFCGFVRSLVDIAVKGKLDFLDGMLFPDVCLQLRNLPRIVEMNGGPPFVRSLFTPPVLQRASSRAYLIDELERLRADLEALSGRSLAASAIGESIALYNENRRLLRTLDDLRRQRPGVVRAAEMLGVVVAGMRMPKEQHNQALEKLVAEVAARETAPEQGVRVVISGSMCQAPKAAVLDLIEELGATIVADDLYTGSRYYSSDARADADPIAALADRYLSPPAPCPTRIDPRHDWGDYLVNTAWANAARGVIILQVKYCEPHCFHYPDIKKKMAAAGIPEILVETGHESESLGPLRTRLQAFIEMIGG